MSGNVGQERDLAALMRAAQTGDRRAYSALLFALLPLLREALRHRSPFLHPHATDDLFKDFFLSLPAGRPPYDPNRPFLPWLGAFARNRMGEGARRYARRAAHEVATEQPLETFPAD